MWAPAGLHFAALSSRFAIARSSVAGRPDGGRRRQLSVDRDVGMVPRRSPNRLLGNEVEADLFERRLLLLAARELGQLADQRRHLGELGDDVGEKLRPVLVRNGLVRGEHLDVRAQAGERRAKLMRRVLDELTLTLRRVVERREHRVEGRRELAQLVVSGHLDPLGQVLGRPHVLGGVAQATNRPQGGARDEEARPPTATPMPPIATRISQSLILESAWSARDRAEAAIWSA